MEVFDVLACLPELRHFAQVYMSSILSGSYIELSHFLLSTRESAGKEEHNVILAGDNAHLLSTYNASH